LGALPHLHYITACNACNALLTVCLHGCANARALKQTFSQCEICLEETRDAVCYIAHASRATMKLSVLLPGMCKGRANEAMTPGIQKVKLQEVHFIKIL